MSGTIHAPTQEENMTITMVDTLPCFRCQTPVKAGEERELNQFWVLRYACDECFQHHKLLAAKEYHALLDRQRAWGINMPWQYKRNMRNIIAARYGVLDPRHPRYELLIEASTQRWGGDKKKGS